MSGSGALLEVRDLTLRFRGITALGGVSFEAAPSELLAVVGPNGAGKTALLNCINGIYAPQSGRITVDGEDLVGRPLHAFVERGIGRSFQHAELFPHLTVTENLLVGRHTRFRAGIWAAGIFAGRARREEIDERRRAEAIVDFFELYRYRDVVVSALPYGLQKLVGVARAMTTEPRVLLLDEPCTGLIREERENFARFLLRMRYELRPTIVWVEHDMQMVLDLADRIIVLDYGKLIAQGAPESVRKNEAVIEAYLGRTASSGALAR